MSSTINNCNFDPSGKKNYSPINPVTPLQQNGQHDISSLVNQIVTKDFGYAGSSTFTLTLRNNKMVLQLWDTQTKLKLKLISGAWTSKDGTTLANPNETSSRLASTLHKINNAYSASHPASPPNEGKGKEEAHVEGHASNEITETLNALRRQINELERKVQRDDNPDVDRLASLIDPLHAKIASLQRNVEELKEPLDKLAKEVPEALREINESIQQIRIGLARLPNKSDGAQALIKQDISSEIRHIRDESAKLEKTVQDLQQEMELVSKTAAHLRQRNEELEETNEDLKAQLEVLQSVNDALVAHDKERHLTLEQLRIEKEFSDEQLADATKRLEEAKRLEDENNYLMSGIQLAQKVVAQDAETIRKLEERLRETTQPATSGNYLSDQHAQLQRRINEMEAAQRRLKDQLTLKDRVLKQLAAQQPSAATVIDLRNAALPATK